MAMSPLVINPLRLQDHMVAFNTVSRPTDVRYHKIMFRTLVRRHLGKVLSTEYLECPDMVSFPNVLIHVSPPVWSVFYPLPTLPWIVILLFTFGQTLHRERGISLCEGVEVRFTRSSNPKISASDSCSMLRVVSPDLLCGFGVFLLALLDIWLDMGERMIIAVSSTRLVL
jgi:hypothetical protein